MASQKDWKLDMTESDRDALRRLCRELKALPPNVRLIGPDALSNLIPIVQILADLVLPPDQPDRPKARPALPEDADEDSVARRRALDEVDQVEYEGKMKAWRRRLDLWRKPWREVLDAADAAVDGKKGVAALLGVKK